MTLKATVKLSLHTLMRPYQGITCPEFNQFLQSLYESRLLHSLQRDMYSGTKCLGIQYQRVGLK